MKLLTLIHHRPRYAGVGRMMVCKMEMEHRLDQVTTIVTAVFVAVYAAIAIRYVACYDLGFSFPEIRGAAVAIAAVVAPFVAIDFFGKEKS